MLSRGRGVGGRRGPVRIKVARVIQQQEALLKNQGNTDGLYEDMMLYVKDQAVTTRKRGRPKKIVQQTSQRVNNSPEVIYVPSARCGKFMPITTIINNNSLVQVQSPSGGNRSLVRHNFQGVMQSTAVQPANHLLLPINNRKSATENGKVNWPEDLQELVGMWDSLPETNMKEVVKWLTSPAPIGFPKIVQNIHTMVNEWDESVDQKIHQIGNWLQEPLFPNLQPLSVQNRQPQPVQNSQPPYVEAQPLPVKIPPKVVVEAQPNPIQSCGQWTSMAETQKDCAL